MSDLATTIDRPHAGGSLLDKKMKSTSAWVSGAVVLVALLGGLGYIGVHVAQDMSNVVITSAWPYVLLGVALLIALGFEFVNGFHDTANAVATVIYTHSLDPNIAVVWSGLCNLAGVLMSTGTVAFAVITLLPVELILQGQLRRRLRHGLRAADRRHYLEPEHVVVRAARLELAHHGRFHHRRRRCQPDHERRTRAHRAWIGRRSATSSACSYLADCRLLAARRFCFWCLNQGRV